MIAECMIFLATIGTPNMSMSDGDIINEYMSCKDNVPQVMFQYADLYVEHFDEENIDTAVRIGWCESRGKSSAFRKDNKDSGVMQFVSWTWNWVAEKYKIPMWDEWVIMKHDRPYTEQKVSTSSIGFTQERVQFTPYYNIYMASLLAEDIYGRTQWRDWSSSEWCWGDEDKWKLKWKSEN
jgi:hypothetical protein